MRASIPPVAHIRPAITPCTGNRGFDRLNRRLPPGRRTILAQGRHEALPLPECPTRDINLLRQPPSPSGRSRSILEGGAGGEGGAAGEGGTGAGGESK